MSSATDAALPGSRKRLKSVLQRRQNKPLIEKRRRARINECLLQLKGLLMKDMGKESPRPSKLEKADILEMTVDYIKKLADKKPESTNVCWVEKTTAGPFIDGFNRCMEEVDAFLDNQLKMQPELRHKLLSHCKEQLTSRDVTFEELPEAASRHSESPVNEQHDSLKGILFDGGSDNSPDDELKVKGSCYVIDASYKTQPAESTATVPPYPQNSTQASNISPQTTTDNRGIKLAGPLRLICGGNVIIVVDQQQQHNDPSRLTSIQPVLGGQEQLFYSPSVYSAGAFATCLPSLPHMNVSNSSFVRVKQSSSTLPLIAATVSCSDRNQRIKEVSETVRDRLGESSLSSPVRPSLNISQNAWNDLNNNEVNSNQFFPVWRPW